MFIMFAVQYRPSQAKPDHPSQKVLYERESLSTECSDVGSVQFSGVVSFATRLMANEPH